MIIFEIIGDFIFSLLFERLFEYINDNSKNKIKRVLSVWIIFPIPFWLIVISFSNILKKDAVWIYMLSGVIGWLSIYYTLKYTYKIIFGF